jgi:hypothetical protein
VALVDLEDLYGPDLAQPDKLPGGSPGYAHKTAPTGLWSADADRFAGAVLLAEMLGWCDARVCQATFGETYFDPDEMQQHTGRYSLLFGALRDQWGVATARMFAQAWYAETLEDCPRLGEWAATLGVTIAPPGPSPGELVSNGSSNSPRATEAENGSSTDQISYHISDRDAVNQDVQDMAEAYRHLPQIAAISYTRALLRRGMLNEQFGDLAAALADYRNAHLVAPPTLQAEVETKIAFLEAQHNATPQPCGLTQTIAALYEPGVDQVAVTVSPEIEGIPTVKPSVVSTNSNEEWHAQQLLADRTSSTTQKPFMWPIVGTMFFMLVLLGLFLAWLSENQVVP